MEFVIIPITNKCFINTIYKGMTSFLKINNIRIFNYPRFAESLCDHIRTNAETIAHENGLEIQFINKHLKKYLLDKSAG